MPNHWTEFRHLEDSPTWGEMLSELESATVAQVAHRWDIPASMIRAALRRTGLGRAVRVVRPEMLGPPDPPPIAAAAPPPTRPSPPAEQAPAASRPARPPRRPEPRPRARRSQRTRSVTPIPREAPLQPPPAPSPPAPVLGPGWAWRVELAAGDPVFVVAPTLAAAAEICAVSRLPVTRIERYAPVLGH